MGRVSLVVSNPIPLIGIDERVFVLRPDRPIPELGYDVYVVDGCTPEQMFRYLVPLLQVHAVSIYIVDYGQAHLQCWRDFAALN